MASSIIDPPYPDPSSEDVNIDGPLTAEPVDETITPDNVDTISPEPQDTAKPSISNPDPAEVKEVDNIGTLRFDIAFRWIDRTASIFIFALILRDVDVLKDDPSHEETTASPPSNNVPLQREVSEELDEDSGARQFRARGRRSVPRPITSRVSEDVGLLVDEGRSSSAMSGVRVGTKPKPPFKPPKGKDDVIEE
ncbi:hypothetical protein NLI96_g1090 [Meripilus lineatus]|uniref:Uncharacterized protein n=1 Tax=Meripilus lineatus TaxID=2056292 RepID=A0AAD5VBI6_9APHY|nr:hypothetical protein NLI96_g1090 [Physisporinus lineatus]